MAEIDSRIDTIERKLSALLAVSIHRLLLEEPSLARPRPRNIDQLLTDAGLRQAEIAELLGKTQQAVSTAVSRARKRPAE